MQRLFDEKGLCTEAGSELHTAACKMLWPLMRGLSDDGHSVRDISHVVMTAVFDVECELMLGTRGKEKEQDERSARKAEKGPERGQ